MHDHTTKSSRRAFLQRMSFAAAAGSLLASCRFKAPDEAEAAAMNLTSGDHAAFSCTDISNLTEKQIQTRKALEYVEDSPHADKRCNNCRLFEPPGEGDECGGCQVVPGPIHPKGYCTAWISAAG